jgi:imidazolonepropionase
MIRLFKNPVQIITVNTNGKNYKRGKEHSQIDVLTDHSIITEDGRIKDIVTNSHADKILFDSQIDLSGKIILPGLIECHTHTVFAGSRANEFKQKLTGKSYEEIANSGGGIISTVNAVRNTSEDELFELIKPRIKYYISQGITTLEIKSGYGLDFENEIKILSIIKKLNGFFPIDIIPTFLGAHTIPPEFKQNREGYLKLITDELLPYISANKLAVFCDAFCESTAFTAVEVDLIFDKSKALGLIPKLHTEQFNNIGGLDIALKHHAASVDHLEVIFNSDVTKFSGIETVAVLLPGVSFFLDYTYAPARKLIDNDAIVALATDYNPGSSQIANLNLIMSIAAIKMKMTFEEIISAVTINSAKALNLSSDRGSIEVGKKADFSIFDSEDYSEIIYNVGKNLNCMTIKNGEIIYDSST